MTSPEKLGASHLVQSKHDILMNQERAMSQFMQSLINTRGGANQDPVDCIREDSEEFDDSRQESALAKHAG